MSQKARRSFSREFKLKTMAAFISGLRTTADALAPLTRSVTRGSRVWDGTSYALADTAEAPHPYALAWWLRLRTIADLLEAQDAPVSAKQISWLHQVLFGGMGSLNDLGFDQATLRSAGSDLNERLQRCRAQLFQSFLKLGQA